MHAHLLAAISNTSYYEYVPGGDHDEAGRAIGFSNPLLPENGRIRPPDGPGWGAEWDEPRFSKAVVAEY